MLTQTELDRFVAEQAELDRERLSLQQIHCQQIVRLEIEQARSQSYRGDVASSLAGMVTEMAGTAVLAIVGALAVLAIFG